MPVSVCWEFKNLVSGVHELWLVRCGVSVVEYDSSGHLISDEIDSLGTMMGTL